MAKRVLVSILLTVVIVAAVALAASVIFSGQYEDLAMLQTSPTPDPTFGLDLSDSLPAGSDASQSSDGTSQTAAESAGSGAEDMLPTTAVQTPTPVTISIPGAEARRLLADMTLEEKIYQMMFVTPEVLTGYAKVTQSGAATKTSVGARPVGGVIYFSNNLVTMNQTQTMLENIQAYSQELHGIGLFLGVDEEGGSVARVGDNLGTTTFDDMRIYGEAGDPAVAREIGTTLATDLKEVGFNVDFAPVADVLTNKDNTVVADRSFGSDPELVADMVAQEVSAFVENGILCAPKHFPGHGSTGDDTHDGLAASDRTLAELENCDFLPFQAAIQAGAPMVMVGHMTMTEIDEENPASLSYDVVTGLLREKLGYRGVIITDAMDMDAITDTYTSGEAAVKAIQAGCDMVLCVSNLTGAVSAVEEAVEAGEISEDSIDESVLRILQAKVDYGLIP